MEKPTSKLSKSKSDQDYASYSTHSAGLSSISVVKKVLSAVKISKLPIPKFPKVITKLVVGLIVLVLVSFGSGWLGARTYDNSHGLATASRATKQQYISNESELISQIAKDVGQSVVSINATSQTTTTDFFGYSQPISQTSSGTGFIISPSGIIVTNRHVVPSGTTQVSVTLADGTKFDNVQVIGRTSDASSQDIAFLKIGDLKSKTLTAVTLGDSSKITVGQRVIAIGNALGQFQNTVTSGIISGYGRDVTAGDQSGLSASESLTDLFQTDAAINEGNSGGPLADINGNVIGVNTAIASNAQNIGFAQPINDLKGLISSVLGTGELQQPYLGVRYVSLTDDLAYRYNLTVKRGAYVVPSTDGSSIVANSPAAKAGIHEKDIITKVNNLTIDDKTSLTSAISHFKVGDKITLQVVRGTKNLSIKVTLDAAPTGN